MLSGFPASAGIDADAQIRVYLLSVDGLATEAIGRAARLFIAGKVKGQNKDFAPSCAAFADECRNQQLIIEAEQRPRIEAKPDKADEGPRVDPRKLILLQKALRGHNPSRAKLRRMFPHIDIPDVPTVSESE